MSSRRYGKWSSALSRALTLDERIQLLQASNRKHISGRQAARAKKIIAVWKNRKPFSTSTVFQDRLNDQMMDEAILTRAIAMPITHTVRRHVCQKRIWKNYVTLMRGHLDGVRYSEEVEDRWGFSQLVRPLLEQIFRVFRSQVEVIVGGDLRGMLTIEAVCQQFERDLIDHTTWIIQKTCLLELRVAKLSGRLNGNSGAERYTSYLKLLDNASYVGQLFLEYPVLLEIIAERANLFCANMSDFLTNFIDNISLVEDVIFDGSPLSHVMDWKIGKGDSHCGGKSVITIRFEDGKQLIYKPRSLSVDVGFNQLVAWCNEKSRGRPLRTVRTLDCGSHGWCEYIEQRELDSNECINDFYYRQGKFIALFYALQANDLHYENMIACGADPVYVDLETLFHTPPSVNTMVDTTESVFTPAATVLDTFILPVGRLASEDKSHIDISIFGANPSQELPPSLLEAETGTDEAHLREKVGILGSFSHLPRYQGETVTAESYVETISAGFIEFYQMFQRESQFLLVELPKIFLNAKVRHLIRTTGLYSAFVNHSLHPDYLRNELERRALFERLFSNVKDQEWLNRLLDSEMHDMAKLDVPYFYRHFDQDGFFDSRGRAIPHLRLASPKSIVSHHLSRLCESDLVAQLRLIELSLLPKDSVAETFPMPCPAHHIKYEVDNSSVDHLKEAMVISNALRSKVVCSGGDSYWMCQMIRGNSLVVTSPNVLDLYDGQLGIALYLGMFSAATGLSDFESLTMDSLETIRRWTRGGRSGFVSSGVYNGSMGYAYVFANLGICLQRNYLLDEAFEWIAKFDPEREKDGLDIVGGAAGCILFLSELHSHPRTNEENKNKIFGLIDFFAQRIASEARRQIVGVSWRIPMKADRALTGFAHGNAGFAAALFVCAKVLSQEKYRELGHAAVSFENHHFSKEHGGWRDLMDDKEGLGSSGMQCAWCRGVPGILLGRLIALETINSADEHYSVLAADVARGYEAAMDHEHSDNASLCHGDLGNNEIFEMAHRVLSEGDWPAIDKKMVGRSDGLLHRRCGDLGRNPIGSRFAAQGLMVGHAGIGYGLLRHAAQLVVPSILRLGVARMR